MNSFYFAFVWEYLIETDGGLEWLKDLKKLNLQVDERISLDGTLPSLEDIPSKNDLFFVWTGTTTGISINNLNFLSEKRKGIVVSDITSAAFIYDIPWKKIDVSVFSTPKMIKSIKTITNKNNKNKQVHQKVSNI